MAKRQPEEWNLGQEYSSLRLLGKGTYGQVLLALRLADQRPVAVKRVKLEFDERGQALRILRQIFIHKRLRHPNVCEIYEARIGVQEGHEYAYLFMQKCEGDLTKLLLANHFLEEKQVTLLAAELLAALQHLHSLGLLHRDIKPANILIAAGMRVKLCDFGLARPFPQKLQDKPVRFEQQAKAFLRGEEHEEGARLSRHVVSRYYRAPEVILLKNRYGAGVDIWAAGCVVAELLGTLKQVQPNYLARGALFPGKSCYPLSPDQSSFQTEDKSFTTSKDQLSLIIGTIGKPEDPDEDDSTSNHLDGLKVAEESSIEERYHAVTPQWAELLKGMLAYDPRSRADAASSLESGLFADLERPLVEQKELDLGLLRRAQSSSLEEIRELIYSQLKPL